MNGDQLNLDEIEAWTEYAPPRVADLVRALVAEVRTLRSQRMADTLADTATPPG